MARKSAYNFSWEESSGPGCGHTSAAQVVGPACNSLAGRYQRHYAFKTNSERLDRHAEMGFRSTDY